MVAKSDSVTAMTALSTVKTSPKWSFNGKQNYDGTSPVPGPGAYSSGPQYDQSSRSHKPSRVVFGTSAREAPAGTPSPGPGSYFPGDTHKASPKFGFGTGKRNPSANKLVTPGPGTYEAGKGVGQEGSRYTVSGKGPDLNMSKTPGPGAYTPARALKRTPTWSFGTSSRGLDGSGMVTPGPGAYEFRPTERGPKFSMKSRPTPAKRMETPGPGTYGGTITQFGY
jgi:hypothetical protein